MIKDKSHVLNVSYKNIINTNVLSYASLMNAVKSFLLTQNSLNITTLSKIKIPILPVKFKYLLNKNASSKDMYSILNNV